MSTIILLSSSPPPVFARSPTPIEASSPLPSTAALIRGDSPGVRKFRTSAKPRDGFRTAFTTARQVLVEKDGAKNLILGSPRRNRFQSSQDDSAQGSSHDKQKELDSNASGLEKRTSTEGERASAAAGQIQPSIRDSSETVPQPTKQAQKSLSPLLLEKAAARRLDWTPPKLTTAGHSEERTTEYSAGYLSGVVGNFAYTDNTKNNAIPSRSSSVQNPNKRQKIETTNSRRPENNRSAQTPRLIPAIPVTKSTSRKRNRSPAKKGLTITGLATSNFIDQDESNESPMMQYLTSTQAQLNDNDTETLLQTKVRKTKAAAKNLKTTKQAQSQSMLLSPESAMRTYDDQETIFGSASQLAREDSPTLLRETIEAMKQSESLLFSDPFSSPQRTQLTSLENTPQMGISRYRRTRNLWAAAGRDEDNALLHVDTVDLTDSPAIRAAFAGKDVLLQPNARRSKSPVKSGPVSHTNRMTEVRTSVIDIADIDSPCHQQKRTMSSSTTMTTKPADVQNLNEASTGKPEQPLSSEVTTSVLTKGKEKAPPKPNYAGFATSDLQKQIKSFGFKAMRKREKMIELLDRCWEEKHGPSDEASNVESEVVPFGDFLSKVHDLSARPEPKVKKPRAKRNKDENVTEVQPKEKPAKKPRARKKKDAEDENVEEVQKKTKAPRKRKSKASAVAEELVLDIDNIGDAISEEQRALCAFDEWAKPPTKVKTKTKTKAQSQPVESEMTHGAPRPPTPPTTLPHAVDESAPPLPSIEQAPFSSRLAPVQAAAPLLTPTPTPATATASTSQSQDTLFSNLTSLPPIHAQITCAILRQTQSDSSANHNTHPTWHEKILLYDPIVLEDLAQWLNTAGLGAIGEDREVSAAEVRGWCEQRGICCLWKGGWRGNKEGRSA